MKLSIGTAKLNSILSRVSKGVGTSKILPITEYLKMNLESGVLTVTATNAVNHITYIEREVEGEDGEVIVKADTLIKLASKTTKPTLTFTLKENYVEVKGNGIYKIQVFETSEYPSYTFNTAVPKVEVETAVLKKVFAVNKASISSELLVPSLTGYNLGQMCVTTDGVKMCVNETALLADQKMLVTQALADLLSTIFAEKVYVQKDSNKILFTTDNIVIFGAELDGIEQYPDITGILAFDYASYAIVNKQGLLDSLDRLSLFVDAFDNNGVRLGFTESGLDIQDLKRNSGESLEYVEKSIDEEVEVAVNISYLKELLNVVASDKVTVYFDSELPLKIVDGNASMFLSKLTVE